MLCLSYVQFDWISYSKEIHIYKSTTKQAEWEIVMMEWKVKGFYSGL